MPKRRKGAGLGGKDGEKTCKKCSDVLCQPVPLLGHSCVLEMIARGRDPQLFEHVRKEFKPEEHGLMSKEDATQELQKKKEAGLKQRKRKLGY